MRLPNALKMHVGLDHQTSRGILYAARFGYLAKGIVYAVLGVLALLAAFGESGGRLTDGKGAIRAIGSQPFGTVLLWTTALGLFCYAVWEAVRAVLDPEQRGTDRKGLVKRLGVGFSAVLHFGLAVYATQLAYGSSSSGGGTRTWVAKLLSYPFGDVLVALCGAIAVGFGLAQIYKAVKGKVGEQYRSAPLSPTVQRAARRIARVGVFARGIVFPVIGVSLIFAALRNDAGEANGFGDALAELARGPFGDLLLTFVAAGLLAYGVHLFFVARYGRLPAPR